MTLRAVLVLIATLAFAASPLFVPGFGGYEPSQFPTPIEDPVVQPAGYAFSIWGVIYLWLLASAGFGVWKRRADPAWDATRWPLIASLGVGAIWLAVAVASPIWATVLIWVMLGGALAALLRTPDRDLWLLRAPIGLYAGWLTAASAVSIGLIAAGWSWPVLGETGWAFAALALGLAIAVAMLLRRPSLLYGAGITWALIAVFVQNGWSALGLFALVAALGVALLTLVRLGRVRKRTAARA